MVTSWVSAASGPGVMTGAETRGGLVLPAEVPRIQWNPALAEGAGVEPQL